MEWRKEWLRIGRAAVDCLLAGFFFLPSCPFCCWVLSDIGEQCALLVPRRASKSMPIDLLYRIVFYVLLPIPSPLITC
jgi:hypothetical protein